MQPPGPLSPRSTFLCLLVLQAVQLGFVWTGLASAADVFNGRPYLVADYSVNFYWVERAVRFFEASGRGWGYDPFYCAGYPLSFVWNSAAPMQLMAMLFAGWLSPGAVIKLFTFAVALALPTVLYATGRNFGLTPRQALFATLLGQLASIMGIHAWMLGLGMLTGYAISYWALFTLSVLTARLLDPSPLRARHFVTLSLILASALLVHKTAAVILGPPCLLLLLILPWPRRAFLSGAALVAVGANLYWILPLLQFLPDKLFVESVQEWTSAETLRAVLHVKELWAPFGRFAQLFWLQAFLLCSAPFGLWMLRRSRPRTALLLGFTLAFLLGITYLGEHFYLARVVNPYRYIVPLHLLCAIPAAVVANRMLPGPRRALAAGLAGLMLLLLPGFHHWRSYLPLTTEIPPTLGEVIEWIQRETDDQSRIMLEDHGYQERRYARLDPYAATGFSRYVSAFTKRHFIGGPYPYNHLRHRFADFQNGRPFGKRWDRFDPDELRDYLRVYNVRWIIAWSPDSHEFLDARPGLFQLRKTFADSSLRAYEYGREHSFLIQGRGEVEIDFDAIVVDRIVPEDGRIVLSLHWLPLFETVPPRELRRRQLLNDPVGFIEVVDPPERLVIRNRGIF